MARHKDVSPSWQKTQSWIKSFAVLSWTLFVAANCLLREPFPIPRPVFLVLPPPPPEVRPPSPGALRAPAASAGVLPRFSRLRGGFADQGLPGSTLPPTLASSQESPPPSASVADLGHQPDPPNLVQVGPAGATGSSPSLSLGSAGAPSAAAGSSGRRPASLGPGPAALPAPTRDCLGSLPALTRDCL